MRSTIGTFGGNGAAGRTDHVTVPHPGREYGRKAARSTRTFCVGGRTTVTRGASNCSLSESSTASRGAGCAGSVTSAETVIRGRAGARVTSRTYDGGAAKAAAANDATAKRSRPNTIKVRQAAGGVLNGTSVLVEH